MEQGNISGQSIVDPPLYGGGPFSGMVSGTTVKFTSRSEGDSLCPAGACTVVFTGTVSQAGEMSGTYAASYSEGPPQSGTWQLSPATTAETTAEATAEANGETPAPFPTVQIRSTTELFGPSGTVQAPAPKACISERAFVIHIHKLGGLDIPQGHGHPQRTPRAGAYGAHDHRHDRPAGARRGAYVVRITLWTHNDTKITGTRVYHTCATVPSSSS